MPGLHFYFCGKGYLNSGVVYGTALYISAFATDGHCKLRDSSLSTGYIESIYACVCYWIAVARDQIDGSTPFVSINRLTPACKQQGSNKIYQCTVDVESVPTILTQL